MGLGRSALKNVPHFKTKITMIKMTQQKYFEVRQWSAENAVDAKHLNNQEHAAAAAEDDLDIAVKSTTSMVEPIMIVGMGLVVGGIASAMLLPIFNMSKNMRPGN